MLNELLSELCKTGEDFVDSIVETDTAYSIGLTDEFGNYRADEPLFCINKITYKSEDPTYVELNGTECEIPDEYASNRAKVIKLLIRDCTYLDEDQIIAAVNYLYYLGYIQYSLSELYQVCNYLLNLIKVHCTEEEKIDVELMYKNKVIQDFMNLSNAEKLERSKANIK